jgi:hypothetical protein
VFAFAVHTFPIVPEGPVAASPLRKEGT